MLCMVLGKSKKAKKFADKLAQNKENIVFAPLKCEFANYIEIEPDNKREIKDFIAANEINLAVAVDKAYFSAEFKEETEKSTDCLVVCPDSSSISLFLNNSTGKKLGYKSRVLTPKFGVFEKEAAAIEYIQNASIPLIVNPDRKNETESAFIAETKTAAKERVSFLFETGNKKIIAEDYIEGIEYTKYILTDNVCPLNLIETVSYFDEISTNNVNFLEKTCIENIENEIIPSLLNTFLEEGIDYKGILGLRFIVGKKNTPYFLGFLPFFKEIDIDIALNTVEDKFENILLSAALGNSGEKYGEIKTNAKYSISMDLKGGIINSCANTMSKAVELLTFEAGKDEDIAKKALDEVFGYWKAI